MARVRVVIEHELDADHVTFMDDLGNRNLGRKCRFGGKDLVFEMLRRAGSSEGLHDIVAEELRKKGRCVVVLNLTEEQYARLMRLKPR